MKAIHLTAYGNPVQNLQMAESPGTKRALRRRSSCAHGVCAR